MNNIKRFHPKWAVVLASCLLLLAAGCSSGTSKTPDAGGAGNQSGQPAPAVSQEPVTLKFSKYKAGDGKEQLEKYIKPFIAKKYPNITLEYIEGENNNFDSLVASGEVPDFMMVGYANLPDLSTRDYPMDLTELIKKNKLDLNLYNPVTINAARTHSVKGQINALPITINTFALFYNKDIFDKFGVPYPKDEMTWEDAIEIAKKVTRTDAGHQYSGLQYSNNNANFARGVSMQLVDPATNKAAFNNDIGLEVLNTLKSIYSIPGNEFKGKVLQLFTDGSTAMIPWWAQDTLNAIETAVDAGKPFNFDVTTYPHFQGYKGIFEPSTGMYVVGKTSKHQDAAFQVISYLTTSPEVQSFAAEFGDFPSLQMKDIDKIFGSSFKVLKEKNVAGMLKGQFLDNHAPSPYDSIAVDAFNKYSQQFTAGKINDARTALAQAEEETNKNIADMDAH